MTDQAAISARPRLAGSSPSIRAMVRMRDRTKLYTEIYLPKVKGRHPTILVRSPYPFTRPSHEDIYPIRRYLDAGFAFVFQNTRGQYRSEGTFRFLDDDARDGVDSINWIAGQPWSDGRVGMEGSSYAGTTQLLAARDRPEPLKCLMPGGNGLSGQDMFPYYNGILTRGWYLQWNVMVDAECLDELDFAYGDMAAVPNEAWRDAYRHRPLIDAGNLLLTGDKLQSWREVIKHGVDQSFWADTKLSTAELETLDIPVFVTHGWYDVTVGPIQTFEAIARSQSSAYLLAGPWNHAQTYRSHLHDLDNGLRRMPPNGAQDLVGVRLKFFERHLKENISVDIQPDKVRLYVTGANKWLNLPQYPPLSDPMNLYLNQTNIQRDDDTRGLTSRPSEQTCIAEYTYNPSSPTPVEAGPFQDRRVLEARPDILTYTSRAFDRAQLILGEMVLSLHFMTDVPDTDVFAIVTEICPLGRSVAFHGVTGAVRLRYRDGIDQPRTANPHEPVELRISLGHVAHQVDAGHKLRLAIFSAAYPTFDPNTNTGGDPATDTSYRIARQKVLSGASFPSHLCLPIIPTNILSSAWDNAS